VTADSHLFPTIVDWMSNSLGAYSQQGPLFKAIL